MVSLVELQNLVAANPDTEFLCRANINLYDSPALNRLATQAVAGRQLRILTLPSGESPKNLERGSAEQAGHSDAARSSDPCVESLDEPMQVCLCEDQYQGWIPVEECDRLDQAEAPYQSMPLPPEMIRDRLPSVIQYTRLVMQQPNHYLWGGTVGPNYDCSGLMQAAFLSAGIWIPRDAYQQEAFTEAIALDDAEPGDLVFFGTPERTTHVGLYLGDRRYIHSSGKDIGRNGIGIDQLSESGDDVSQTYFKQFKGVGRVTQSYQA